MSSPQPKRIAVIGGGCAGITSFWALQNSIHDVHLFEASPSLGGRIKTLAFHHNGNKAGINTEQPLFYSEASPNLLSLLRHLGLSTSPTPSDFSATSGSDSFQWSSSALKSILHWPWMLCSLEMCRILFDLLRFKYLAIDVQTNSRGPEQHTQTNVHDYLSNEGFSSKFQDSYLSPFLSMLWGTNAGRYLPQFPIDALVRLLQGHRFLCSKQSSSQWQRINKGTDQFIQALVGDVPPEKVHLRTRVVEIGPSTKKRFSLLTSEGEVMLFDHVIFAVDCQEILNISNSILQEKEKDIIKDLRVSNNIAVLHSDPLLMPPNTHTWSSHNYIINPNDTHLTSPATPPKACLTYDINTLQDIPFSLFGRIFITLNPLIPPHPRLVQGVWQYTDTEISSTTLQAQHRLSGIQNKRGLSFCSSYWTGRGFLEDAVTIGLKVAVELGARLSFPVEYHQGRDMDVTRVHRLSVKDHLVRTVLRLLWVWVLVLEILWDLGVVVLELVVREMKPRSWRRQYKTQSIKSL